MEGRAAVVRVVSLRECLPDAEFSGVADLRVTGCCSDSRQCRPGDLFAALPGTSRDGQQFIPEAVARGASAILVDRPARNCPLPACYVTDVREAFGLVCQALANNPAEQLKVVGITGTNGKTTTSLLCASVLESAGCRTGLMGTLAYTDGYTMQSAGWTTPPANVLAHWLSRMVQSGRSHAVLEVSSHALCQRRVAGMEFDVACLTNIRHDHLDYHGSLDRYRAAKARLFDQLRPDGVAIVNVDCPQGAWLVDTLDGPTLTVAMEGQAEITATPLNESAAEQTFLLAVGSESVPVRTPLIGRHNISNCLVASALGVAYGIDLATIARGLEAVQSVPGRLQPIECGQPFHVFVDYAHTADALSVCLDTLRANIRGRLICVFGAGGDRDRTKRPAMGRAVAARSDLAVVTSDNPRSEDPNQIAEQILRGFRSHAEVVTIPDRATAIHWALSQAGEGDCVLIAGKGHETSQWIGQEHYHFDDREVARDWLQDRFAPVPWDRAAA